MRIGQIGVRCLGKSTVAKRGKREIVAQLGGSDGRPLAVIRGSGTPAFLSFRSRLIISQRVRLSMASDSVISSGKSGRIRSGAG